MMRLLHLHSQILLILIIQLRQQARGNNPSSSYYSSITQLDKYGSSSQIKNARLASQLYGTTTIAAVATSSHPKTEDDRGDNIFNSVRNEVIIVVSREIHTAGVIKPNTDNGNKLQIICKDLSSSSTSTTALVGSGLRSDITFLTHLLRRHASSHWERYDSIPDSHRMALGAGQVLQAFHGYERSGEVEDGVLDVLDDGSGKRIQVGRPLAMSLLLVDVFGDDDGGSMATMIPVDPSGVAAGSIRAFGLGRGGEKANDMLGRRWRPNLGVKEVEEMCIGIIRDIAASEEKDRKGKKLRTNDDDADDTLEYIICEILSKEGLSVKRLLLKEDKLL